MYIGNDLQVAESGNKIIDDISSSFNGSTTSFALTVGGYAPVPFPINTQQIYISVNGVLQEPDPSGSAGFKLLGTNIVFSSAPASGHAFFGVILSGADYVTVGTEFPAGSATAPSITFGTDNDTGMYSVTAGQMGFTSNGVQTFTLDGDGFRFNDDKKLIVGSGSDLNIYHSSGNSIIDNNTGELRIQGDLVRLMNSAGSKVALEANVDNNVELYFNNSQKFATTNTGTDTTGVHVDDGATHDGDVTFTGASANVIWDKSADDLIFTDNSKAVFGTSSDGLEIFHNGSDSIINDQGTGTLLFQVGGNTKVTLDNTGHFIIGHTSTQGLDRYLQVIGTDSDSSSMQLIRHSDNASSGSIDFTKSRNATIGSNTIVQQGDNLGFIQFRADDGTDMVSVSASIAAKVDGTPGANDTPGRLEFRTTSDGSASATERMRITSGGNVGIGATSPSRLLHVNAASTNVAARFESTDTEVEIELKDSTGTASIKCRNDFRFANDSGEFGRFSTGGNFGINEAAPAHKLVVGGDAYVGFTTPNDAARQLIFNANRSSVGNTLANINWQWNSTNVCQIRGSAGDDTTNKDNGEISFYTAAAGSLVERMRIDDSGRVGIGSTNPAYLLDLLQTSSDAQLRLRTSDTDANADTFLRFSVAGTTQDNWIYFGDSADSNAGMIVYNHDNDQMKFWTNAAERIRIEDSGDVIFHDFTNNLGSSDAGEGFEFRNGEALRCQRDSGAALIINRNTDDGDLITLRRDGSSKADIGIRSNAFVIDVGANERMRIDSSGNLGIGTDSPAYELDIKNGTVARVAIDVSTGSDAAIIMDGMNADFAGSDYWSLKAQSSGEFAILRGGAEKLRIQTGEGISFNGDSAEANALDDYEEGTWTVQLTGSTSGTSNDGTSGTGFDTASGVYTKVGNTVHYVMHLANVHDGDVAGDLRFSLPFTSGNGQSSTTNLRMVGACVLSGVNYTAVGQANSYIESGDAFCRIAETIDNTGLDWLNTTNVDNDANDIFMAGTFFI